MACGSPGEVLSYITNRASEAEPVVVTNIDTIIFSGRL